MAEPLVSIGIPTYNRATGLHRAVSSALAQTYAEIEVVISDDASTDDTEQVSRALCASDARVRYLRAPANTGLTANFNTLTDEVRGEYVMMLSDDDWLEPDYVDRCLRVLLARRDHALVCGIARYLDGDQVVHSGVAFQLDQPGPRARIVEYLHHVDENGLLYGLMPVDVLRRAGPMRNVLGCDWLLVVGVLAQGKAATLNDTAILRELGGTSADMAKLVRTLGLPAWQARLPHLTMAGELLAEVAWRNDAFATLAKGARWRLAVASASAALDWRSDVWHLTMPSFAALDGRPGLAWLWRSYLWLARLAGASSAGDEKERGL